MPARPPETFPRDHHPHEAQPYGTTCPRGEHAGGGGGEREKHHAVDVEALAASVFGGEITLEELGSLSSLRRGDVC
jgi:hypothetical protein